MPKTDSDLTTVEHYNSHTVENPVLSMKEIADILITTRVEWDAIDKPELYREYFPMFVNSLISRCQNVGHNLSQESAEEHVKRAYIAWNWPTY